MNPDQIRLKYLFDKYLEKTASPEERIELENIISIEANRDQIMQVFMAVWEKYKGDGVVLSEEKTYEILQYILGKNCSQSLVFPMNIRRKFRWWRMAAAAAILLFFIGGYWLLVNNKKSPLQSPVVKNPVNDVNPGAYKAQLILSDGRKITLDSAALGQLAQQGNTMVINKDGQLVYKQEAGPSANSELSIVYNTVATNKGETYLLTLADGSKVWLNAASSIHFPVAFPGKERHIEITGEVYVKVAKNAAQPFVVKVNDMDVVALGTEFNINAYTDEDNIKTTLIEGSVKVSNGTANTILKPGQQTRLLYSNGQLTAAKDIEVEEIIAWKDGFFHFESADLKTILRQFSRWYDVEVVYEGTVPQDRFFVIMSRNITLASVLKALKANEIKFRIEGKKLIVQPE
jgi:hypothetical protein